MQQKFNVGFVTFSYGGNGGISSEVPDIREWMVPLIVDISKDPRIDQIRIWNLADTPITMTRNRAVLQAREFGVDVLVMIDSDMKPDKYNGQPDAKPFFQSSFDFLVNHQAVEPLSTIFDSVGQIKISAGYKTETGKGLFDLGLGTLDPLGNFNFLLTGQ
jgi:hypothetical protein